MTDVEDFYSTYDYDKYILASSMLPKDDGFARALVMRRKRYLDKNIIGSRHSNPFLDTCVYEVQFHDVPIRKYANNLISGNLYSQTDHVGNEFLLFNDILDHRLTDKSLKRAFEGDPKNRKYYNTTEGW